MARKKKAQNIEENCDICGEFCDVVIRFSDFPFVDGKYYKEVCWTCGSLPKPLVVGKFAIGGRFPEKAELYRMSDLLDDGFKKDRIIKSIKHVGAKLKLTPKQIKYLLEH